MHYVVLNLYTQTTAYAGTSLGAAAKALEPGHVYGRAETQALAEREAQRRLKEQVG